jgi:putative phosphoesterase
MKLIFFSDIHGNNHAFDAFIKSLSAQKDQYELVFLGDFIGYYYGANEIISYCRENKVSCVLGNHDKYFLDILDGKLGLEKYVKKYGCSYEIALKTISKENVNFLRQLDKNKTLTSANKKAYICHGSPLDNLEGRIYPDADLSIFETAVKGFNYVVTGHTHHKMDRCYGSTVFLNPGSLGQQRDGKGCSYMILDLEKNAYYFHTVDYSIASLESEIDLYDAGRARLKEVLRRKR